MATNDSDLEAFRAEVREWIAQHAPDELRGTRGAGRFDGYWGGQRQIGATPAKLRWLEVAAERGFTCPTWPVAYGGAGLTDDHAEVLDQELEAAALPPPLVGFGQVMLGPVLLESGTEAQKLAHLPRIARGEIRWCQGYSEPDAGSDLASLRTRAVRDGDHYVVDGQKIWTSHADQADWIFCLVRTNPEAKRRQEGISFLLADMSSPGIEVRPILLISGSSPFCEVFFTGVRVPAEQRIGAEGAGWGVARSLLRHERSTIGRAMGRQLGDAQSSLVSLARRAAGQAEGPLNDGATRSEIARIAMRERCFQLTGERIRQSVEAGEGPGDESSVLKVCGSELKQDHYALCVRLAGPAALGWRGPGFEDDDLERTRLWLRSRGTTIEGGTTEIQLGIIARHVLKLAGGRR